MKSSSLFWGFFFLTIGGLLFMVKYDVIYIDWEFVWDLWPFIFIFWGLAVLTKETIVRPFVSLFFGIFTGIVIFGFFNNIFGYVDFQGDHHGDSVKTFSHEFSDSINYANLEVSAGAGSFILEKETDDLINGTARGNLIDYKLDTTISDSSAWIEINLENKKFNLFDGKIRNNLELQLNRNPVWDLEINVGASKTRFDLSKFKVKKFNLNTGASSTKIILGDNYPRTYLNVDIGAAALEIDIPYSSGCKITGDMVLVSKHLDRFKKRDSNYYITDNYDESENKIAIEVDGGVTSLTVNRK